MVVINDVLTDASDKQVAYAIEENTVLTHQIAINNHIFSNARKITGADIQTFNQLTEYLLSDSKHDKEITALIEDSGYLTLWETDMKKIQDITILKRLFKKLIKNIGYLLPLNLKI